MPGTRDDAPAALNPLEGLPSVLAIRDLRRRVAAALINVRRTRDRARELLALDPLTVLRCLRVVHAPINRVQRRLSTLSDLVDVLGTAVVYRALESPVADMTGTGPVRKLWLHAIATATAARSLAQESGELDPEEAYLLGLLHDLPLWLDYLSRRIAGAPPTMGALQWIRQWNLPPAIAAVITETAFHPRRPATREGTPEAMLVSAAELLAELADFWHPDDGHPVSRNLLHSVCSKDELVAAQNLRRDVTATLQAYGLEAVVSEPEPTVLTSDASLSIYPVKHAGNIADVVMTLLGCSSSSNYRGIVTAATAAALRFLSFERSYFLKYNRAHGRGWLRAKADLSPHPLRPTMLHPAAHELACLERALVTGQPQQLNASPEDTQGLLQLLGTDQVLVVPMNIGFAQPAFLILDRALSGSPIRLRRDAVGCQALAGTTSLLVENLLLKKRRQRAQRLAFMDPLTHLANRAVGLAALAQELARAERHGAPLTILMLDLDDFKKLNDVHGHLAGDQALRATADVLRRTLRRTDTLCRYGGEEFLVVLPETPIEEAAISATRLHTAVANEGLRLQLPLTVSIGIASLRPHEDTLESMLSRADQALYASKLHGRNRFSVDGD